VRERKPVSARKINPKQKTAKCAKVRLRMIFRSTTRGQTFADAILLLHVARSKQVSAPGATRDRQPPRGNASRNLRFAFLCANDAQRKAPQRTTLNANLKFLCLQPRSLFFRNPRKRRARKKGVDAILSARPLLAKKRGGNHPLRPPIQSLKGAS
jgi:hypothetical protein